MSHSRATSPPHKTSEPRANLSSVHPTPGKLIASRPFDKNRDGFVLGEGAGSLILEDLDHALSRGAKIYAELIGIGMSADAHHITAPHPEGKGAKIVMRNALRDTGIIPGKWTILMSTEHLHL